MTLQERKKFEPVVAKLQKSRKTRVAAEAGLERARLRLHDAQDTEQLATREYREACKLLIEGEPETVVVTREIQVKPEGGPVSLGDPGVFMRVDGRDFYSGGAVPYSGLFGR